MDTKTLLQKLIESQEPLGKDVYIDIETYQGDPELLGKEIAWETRALKEDIAELEESAQNAMPEVEALTARLNAGEKVKGLLDEAKKPLIAYEKALAKIEDKAATMREKAALKDSAKIICAAVCWESQRVICHFMPLGEEEERALSDLGIKSIAASCEEGMLMNIQSLLNSIAPVGRLFLYSKGYFDANRLRARMAFYNVPKPDCIKLDTDTQIIDLMGKFCRFISVTKDAGFAKLAYACDMLGIDNSKIGDGSEVAGLYESGEWVKLLAYCTLDAVVLESIKNKLYS